MKKSLVVVKLGGHAMDKQDLLDAFSENIRRLLKNMDFVLVHGGGPHINSLLKRLQIESRFVNGLRVTDDAVLEAVELTLCGAVNKAVTRQLLKTGIDAAGISGEDGELLIAEIRDPQLGHVGNVVRVSPQIVKSLLAGGFTPVIAPLALTSEYSLLNVNADTAAGAIAGALQADFFILISDVPGVLDEDKELLPALTRQEIERLCKAGTISGGMIPKVECCLEALAAGCKKAVILDGTKADSLAGFLESGRPNGTAITD